MEKFLEPYDKEYMRLAILKHEETFKEQVHELHRLYRMQKILMKNIANSRINTLQSSQEIWNSKNGVNFAHKSIMKLDLEMPAEDYAAESSGNRVLELIDENEIELTLGPSSYNNGRRRKVPKTPLTSDSGPSSFSSSSTGSSHINGTNSLNHQRMNTKSEKSGGCELGLVDHQVPDMTLGLVYHQVPDMTLGGYKNQSENKTSIDVVENLRQERLKQPTWLFQVLSLNMT